VEQASDVSVASACGGCAKRAKKWIKPLRARGSVPTCAVAFQECSFRCVQFRHLTRKDHQVDGTLLEIIAELTASETGKDLQAAEGPVPFLH